MTLNVAWVYIVLCSDGTFYTGCTTHLRQRMAQHAEGCFGGYTSTRRPVKLVWLEEFPDIWQAIEMERMLKGWSHKKKAALVEGDFALIHQLAQSREMRERRARRTEVVLRRS